MTELRHVRCGACRADQPEIVGAPCISEQAKFLIPYCERMRVVRCTHCGFFYTDPMPFWDEGDLQTLYAEKYFVDESLWWHHARTEVDPRRRLDAIDRETEVLTPKLLDVGCGQGYVMEQALQRGWDVWGLEPSKTWAQKTSTRLGVKVWAQRVEKAELPLGTCDVVFSDSVIEHLPEPATMMNLAWRVLKPRGIAYLVTPNADALVNHFRGMVFRLSGSKRSPYTEPLRSPYHVVGFTPHSISVMAKRAGFEVRGIWVRHGRDEWRKEKRWTIGKVKLMLLWPVLFVGELIGMGTTIDILLIRP